MVSRKSVTFAPVFESIKISMINYIYDTEQLSGYVYGFASTTKTVGDEGEVQAGEFVHEQRPSQLCGIGDPTNGYDYQFGYMPGDTTDINNMA